MGNFLGGELDIIHIPAVTRRYRAAKCRIIIAGLAICLGSSEDRESAVMQSVVENCVVSDLHV